MLKDALKSQQLVKDGPTQDDGVNMNYSTLEQIGEGTYGVMYKAFDKQTDKFVAIKKIQTDS